MQVSKCRCTCKILLVGLHDYCAFQLTWYTETVAATRGGVGDVGFLMSWGIDSFGFWFAFKVIFVGGILFRWRLGVLMEMCQEDGGWG